jgi:hypothetical protein
MAGAGGVADGVVRAVGREESDQADRPESPVGALVRAHRRRPLVSRDCRMRRTDSNPRDSAWESGILPAELLPLSEESYSRLGQAATLFSQPAGQRSTSL